jgi:hypothetical protein
MNELQALLSPTSLPCNSSTDPADVQVLSVQLTVINIAQTMVDLTNSGLRIEFVVDPGGIGSASALILSQYSADQSATGSPAPAFTVDASAALGTAWTITQTDDAPCAFLAIPEAGAGQLAPSPGPGQPSGSASFVFANLAVDLVPGASPVTVTVLPGSTATVADTPLITKTGPGLAITGFNAIPAQLAPPSNQSVLTWSTLGAATCELSWNQSTTAVVYNGQTVTSPWTAPPQVTAEAPVTATLFQNTLFTLLAQGAAPVTSFQPVSLDQPGFAANANKVAPWSPFTLSWNCFDGTEPSLTWQVADGGEVTVTSGSGTAITQGSTLDVSGKATATITATTTFNIHVVAGSPPLAVQVTVDPLTFNSCEISSQQVGPASGLPDGVQTATFAWNVQNASGFTLSGGGNTLSLPYTATTATVGVLPDQGPVQYTFIASGPDQNGNPTTHQENFTVTPIQVTGLTASSSSQHVTRGTEVVLSWHATAATGFTVASSPASPPILQPTPFTANATDVVTWPSGVPTTTYTITAHGYTGGNPEPSATVAITVIKPKDKEKEKEKEGKELFAMEKQPPDHVAPFLEQSETSDTDLPSGTQQAFIGSDERPSFGTPGGGDPDA